jgi:hypothetical protein
MASLSVINDVTKPIDTSNWIPSHKKSAPTKVQNEAVKSIAKMESNLARSATMDMDAELEETIQESMPWTIVTNKKGAYEVANVGIPESIDSMMKKMKVTLTIRTPKDTTDFSPAVLHIDTLHEIHKFDESMNVFSATGNTQINIESPMSEA